MTILTAIIVAIWWNPYAIAQDYYSFTQERVKQIEERDK